MCSPNDADLSCTGANGATMTNIDAYRIRENMIEGWVYRVLLVIAGSFLLVLDWKDRASIAAAGIALGRDVHGVAVFLGMNRLNEV